jgi:hypothetical protein
MTTGYYSLEDLSHDPKLAEALGNMVVTWAYAENTLLQVISRVTGAGLNMALAGYYRIPTFESRTKFLLAIISEWDTSHYDKDAIILRIEKLGKLASTRNRWVHGDWCSDLQKASTIIFNHRADENSPDRRKPVKGADVTNHCQAVLKWTKELAQLIDTHSLKP